MTTYLAEAFEDWTEDDWRRQAENNMRNEEARDLLESIAKAICEAYQASEITADRMLSDMERAAKASGLGTNAQGAIVGYWILVALRRPAPDASRKKGRQPTPEWIRDLAIKGVEYAVQKHGAVKNRLPAGDRWSAFEVVSDYLYSKGVVVSERNVERWYCEAKGRSTKK